MREFSACKAGGSPSQLDRRAAGLGSSRTCVDTDTDRPAQHLRGWLSEIPKQPASSANSKRNQPEPLFGFPVMEQWWIDWNPHFP